MAQLRAIVIDDNRANRDAVIAALPEYVECAGVGSGNGAFDYFRRDEEGNLPDFVIVNADDPKNFGLYVFDWMINKSGDEDIASIPVIVLTKDEFSDRCLEFLELGDVMFYEGEIDDSELFAIINDAIEEAEFMPVPVVAAYEETKNIDRLMGHSVKAPEGGQRAVVIDMDKRVKNLEAALERGRQRVSDIRTLLDAAQRVKDGGDDFNLRRRKKVPKDDAYVNRMSSFLKKARQKAQVEEELIEQMKKRQAEADKKANSGQVIKRSNAVKDTQEKVIRQPADPAAAVADSIGRLKQKAMINPDGAMNAQGMVSMKERPRQKQEAPSSAADPDKKTVVIADDDTSARKLVSFFLMKKYNVVTCESGMKTIDYFVKNKADLLIINPVLGGMSGVSTVISVRMQPGGANIPVMFLVGDNYTESRSKLLGPGVVGLLNKPVKHDVVAQAVDGYFDNASRGGGLL